MQLELYFLQKRDNFTPIFSNAYSRRDGMQLGHIQDWQIERLVRRTIVIEVGMQNAAQAIAIASSPFIFNSGEMALPAICYGLLMNIILLTYIYVIKRKHQ